MFLAGQKVTTLLQRHRNWFEQQRHLTHHGYISKKEFRQHGYPDKQSHQKEQDHSRIFT